MPNYMVYAHGTVTASPLDLLQNLLHTLYGDRLCCCCCKLRCSNILFWSFAICVELAARRVAMPKTDCGRRCSCNKYPKEKAAELDRAGQESGGEDEGDDRLQPVGTGRQADCSLAPHLPLTLLFG